MNGPIYFVADVHLSPQAPRRAELFLKFLDSLDPSGTLYILGDLFDFWVGPKHALLPEHRATLQRIKELAERGLAVRFIYGNRDFYFDAKIAERFGMQVLGEEAVLQQSGMRLFLTHGDQFCTKDHSYRAARRVFRSRPASAFFKNLPVSWSYAMAALYRRISDWLGLRRDSASRAFTEEAVGRAFEAGADVIICGHGHEESSRTYPVAAGQKALYVLGNWSEEGSYLELRDGQFSFHCVTI